MSFSIDKTSYNKAAHYPLRHGYQTRGSVQPSSVIVHTTSNRRASAFTTEANYLFKSADVSSHYLISKTGEIIEFLDPVRFQAWHAGTALPAYLNAKSVGIEHHVSLGEPWTAAMHEACTWLVRTLMEAHGIPPERIDTHRAVALPSGRKRDPEGWDSPSFYAWRSTLAAPPAPELHTFIARGIPVYEQSDRTGPLWGYLQSGETVVIDDMTNGHLADGRGFVKLDGGLEPL